MNLLTGLVPTATLIMLVVSVAIPAVSALLAKSTWPPTVVGLLTMALSAAGGFFTEWSNDVNGFDVKAALGTAVVSYVIAVAAHYGWLRGTDTNNALRRAIW